MGSVEACTEMRGWRRALFVPALTIIALAVGCTSARVQQRGVSDLRKGVADTREQARLAMVEANQLARDQAIARVLALNKAALSEKDFVGAVSQQDIAKWDSSFA